MALENIYNEDYRQRFPAESSLLEASKMPYYVPTLLKISRDKSLMASGKFSVDINEVAAKKFGSVCVVHW